MARALFFAISALLCLALGDSLQCVQCQLDIGYSGCASGVRTCTTKYKQQCMAISISQGSRRLYSIYGCTEPGIYRCGRSEWHFGHEVEVQCCSDSNMCNRNV